MTTAKAWVCLGSTCLCLCPVLACGPLRRLQDLPLPAALLQAHLRGFGLVLLEQLERDLPAHLIHD